MNTKKFIVSVLSVMLAATSLMAWQKGDNSSIANIGRTYFEIDAAANMGKYNAGALKDSPTGFAGKALLNTSIFRPGVNSFKDIPFAGLDLGFFADYDYSGDIEYAAGKTAHANDVVLAAQLKPYLNFDLPFSVFQNIKPYCFGYAGYEWFKVGGVNNSDISGMAYGCGAGVEVTIVKGLVLTPEWVWHANSDKAFPCYQTASVELSYWFSRQLSAGIFWEHDFGKEMAFGSATVDNRHSEVIGFKFRVGFLR